ncbi:MAG: hypothetical protein RB191_04910 [Terriglobia bacterium]|nr:hypothetical protein [Terriglobia bacterium]
MQISEMIQDLDRQIEKLQKARQSLAEVENSGAKGSTRSAASRKNMPTRPVEVVVLPKPKKPMSAESRKKIADAARRRWAERRTATVPKVKLSK